MKKLLVIVAIILAGVNFVNAQQNFIQSFGQSVKSDITALELLKECIGEEIYLEFGEDATIYEISTHRMNYFPADTIWIKQKKKNNKNFKNYKLVFGYKTKDSTITYTPKENIEGRKFIISDISNVYKNIKDPNEYQDIL